MSVWGTETKKSGPVRHNWRATVFTRHLLGRGPALQDQDGVQRGLIHEEVHWVERGWLVLQEVEQQALNACGRGMNPATPTRQPDSAVGE